MEALAPKRKPVVPHVPRQSSALALAPVFVRPSRPAQHELFGNHDNKLMSSFFMVAWAYGYAISTERFHAVALSYYKQDGRDYAIMREAMKLKARLKEAESEAKYPLRLAHLKVA